MADHPGSCPRARSAWARPPKLPAAASGRAAVVWPGRRRSGSVKAHFSSRRLLASRRSSRARTCTSGTVPVKAVWMTMVAISETISSGGFPAPGCRAQLLEGILEVLALALVLPAEAVLFPHVRPAVPAPALAAPSSKQYQAPVGSVSAGVGSSRRRHRSRKCSWAAERSLRVASRHLVMNSGVMGSGSSAGRASGSACSDRGRYRPLAGAPRLVLSA